MFGSALARIIWTLVAVIRLSLLAAVLFVAAAIKGVVKPWPAAAYVVVEIAILGFATAVSGNDPKNWTGLLLVLLMLVSATHTALLDSKKVRIGSRRLSVPVVQHMVQCQLAVKDRALGTRPQRRGKFLRLLLQAEAILESRPHSLLGRPSA